MQRPVQPEALEQLLLLLQREGRLDVGRQRVAGHEAENQEQYGGYRPQNHDHLQEPVQQPARRQHQ